MLNFMQNAPIEESVSSYIPNSIKLYFDEISNYSLLSREEEESLAKQGDREAKNELVKHNLRLVVYVAKKYTNRGMSLQDLIQEGNCGLMRAVEKYDVSMGFKFSTYATYWIKQAISRALMEKNRNIRIPSHVLELLTRVRRVEVTLTQDYGRDPTDEELATAADLPMKKIKELKAWIPDCTSLDINIGDDEETTIGSLIEDSNAVFAFDEIEKEEAKNNIDKVLNTLQEREKYIIIRRFGLNLPRSFTLDEVGKELKISKERVRQIENVALKKLRHPSRIALLREFLED